MSASEYEELSVDATTYPSLDDAAEEFIGSITRSVRTRETYALGIKSFRQFLETTDFAGCEGAPPLPRVRYPRPRFEMMFFSNSAVGWLRRHTVFPR